MNSKDPIREIYPHREAGVALIALAVLLMIVAVLVGGTCQPQNFSGPAPGPGFSTCLYPYAAGAVLMGGVGFVLFVVGLVLLFVRNPSLQPLPPVYAPPWMLPLPPPPPPGQVACKNCGRVYYVGQFGFCPNCGTKIGS